jgi:hypothetical protein
MKFFVRTASGQTRTFLARALSFVLLAGIVHAITFGAAHSHVLAGSSLDSGQAISSSGQAQWTVPAPINYRTDRQECLICLFHQQLFNSVIHTPFYVAEHAVDVAGSGPEKLLKFSSSFTSTPIERLSGRAPPRR